MKSLVYSRFNRTSFAGSARCRMKFTSPNRRWAVFGLGVMLLGLLLNSHKAAAAAFSPTPPLFTARGAHTATLLSDGKLLVAGGKTSDGLTSSRAERYDPATGSWTATGSMNAERAQHT